MKNLLLALALALCMAVVVGCGADESSTQPAASSEPADATSAADAADASTATPPLAEEPSDGWRGLRLSTDSGPPDDPVLNEAFGRALSIDGPRPVASYQLITSAPETSEAPFDLYAFRDENGETCSGVAPRAAPAGLIAACYGTIERDGRPGPDARLRAKPLMVLYTASLGERGAPQPSTPGVLSGFVRNDVVAASAHHRDGTSDAVDISDGAFLISQPRSEITAIDSLDVTLADGTEFNEPIGWGADDEAAPED